MGPGGRSPARRTTAPADADLRPTTVRAGRRPAPAGDLGTAAARLPGAERGRAAAARGGGAAAGRRMGEEYEPIETVAEAVLELLQSGDGSLGMLDVPELDPLDGVVWWPRWTSRWTRRLSRG